MGVHALVGQGAKKPCRRFLLHFCDGKKSKALAFKALKQFLISHVEIPETVLNSILNLVELRWY